MKQTATKTRSGLGINNKREKLFYALFIAIPVIHFLVFYVYINFNSILLTLVSNKVTDSWLALEFKLSVIVETLLSM